MDKDQAERALTDLLEQKTLQDPEYEETVDSNGRGFIESNLDDIVALGNGSWNNELAERHIHEMRATFLDETAS